LFKFRVVSLISGPVLCMVTVLFLPDDPNHPLAVRTAGIAAWMGIWWLTEAVPLAVTSLLPLVFFPAMGVLRAGDVASTYMNDVVFLFVGGFIVALAMERWNLHKRIALLVLLVIGGGPRRTLFGFIVATAFLSMWISNTATAMMMVPIALAVLSHYEGMLDNKVAGKLSVGLLLGVAYSASIGGIATLVGTPPNLAFAQIFTIQFPRGPEITFGSWMIFALPLSIIMLGLTWLVLVLMYLPKVKSESNPRKLFQDEMNNLGKMAWEEKAVLAVFIALALLWISRRPLQLGSLVIPGWSGLLPEPGFIGDGTVAITLAVLLFIIPSRDRSKRIMDWSTTRKLPWNIVLLFGGGFALASAFTSSGLSDLIGNRMQGLSELPPVITSASICTLMTFLTELTSNTATTQMALPILAATAVAIQRNPFMLMIPATLSASCAFMMPVATPPNAIIFGSGKVKIWQMAKTGILLNLAGVVLIVAWMHLLGRILLNIDGLELPDWAGFSNG